MPGLHCRQALMACAEAYVPLGQAGQLLLPPPPPLAVPTAQALQALEDNEEEKNPAVQGAQTDDPVEEAYEPGEQALHADSPDMLLKVPSGQGRLLPTTQYAPAVHTTHVPERHVELVESGFVCAGHGVQLLRHPFGFEQKVPFVQGLQIMMLLLPSIMV